MYLRQVQALGNLVGSSLAELGQKDWPRWKLPCDVADNCNNLGKLMGYLRNAASHRRLMMSSDARDMEKADITFDDAPGSQASPSWRAGINAAELRQLCYLFTEQIEELIG
jgi:hypothetical protein